MKLLVIFLGGGLGACSRYLLLAVFDSPLIGIWSINVVGSALLGIITALVEKNHISDLVFIFLTTGLIASLTTYATWGQQLLQLFQSKHYPLLLLNVFSCIIVALFIIHFSHKITRHLL